MITLQALAKLARDRDALWCALRATCMIVHLHKDGHASELRQPIERAG